MGSAEVERRKGDSFGPPGGVQRRPRQTGAGEKETEIVRWGETEFSLTGRALRGKAVMSSLCRGVIAVGGDSLGEGRGKRGRTYVQRKELGS